MQNKKVKAATASELRKAKKERMARKKVSPISILPSLRTRTDATRVSRPDFPVTTRRIYRCLVAFCAQSSAIDSWFDFH